MSQLTWLVTGTSSGFGEQYVHSILERGDNVIATARRGAERLHHLKDAGAAILDLDVTASQSELDVKVKEALEVYGGIDVLVNNAGYIEAGIIEELDDSRLRKAFETNLFGPMNLTRSLLPHFRNKHKGVILFMGSIGAHLGAVGAGAYSATKGALESMVGCLQEEVSPFGIQCCLITPGFYRTNIFAPTNIKIDPSSIPDYVELNKLYQAGVAAMHESRQQGDPRKATDRVVDMVRSEGNARGKPIPDQFPLGADAVEVIRGSCSKKITICDEWEAFTADTKLDAKD